MNDIFQTTIDKSGRVTIPAQVLSELHLALGSTLLIQEKDGKITLEPIEEEPDLIEKDGLLIVRPKLTGDIEDAVRQHRERRISDLNKGFIE